MFTSAPAVENGQFTSLHRPGKQTRMYTALFTDHFVNTYSFSDSRLVSRQSRSQTDRSDFIPMSMPVHHPALYQSKDNILESKRELPDENENTEVIVTHQLFRILSNIFRKILTSSMNLKMMFLSLKKRNLKVVQERRRHQKGFRYVITYFEKNFTKAFSR